MTRSAPPTAAETTAPIPVVPRPRPARRTAADPEPDAVPAPRRHTAAGTGPDAARGSSGTGTHAARTPAGTPPRPRQGVSETGPYPARRPPTSGSPLPLAHALGTAFVTAPPPGTPPGIGAHPARTPADTGPHAPTPTGTGPFPARRPAANGRTVSETGPYPARRTSATARTVSETGPHPARRGGPAEAAAAPSRPGPATAGCSPQLTASMRPDRRPASLRRHREIHGELRRIHRGELTEMIGAAGLRGRGGAGFPVADKLRTAARSATTRAPQVVVNGAESEPASIKDRALLTRAPHLVLDGAQLLADELGARGVTVWVHSARAEAVVTQAVEQRLDLVPVRVVRAPEGYLAGESSAALAHLAGGPARPAFALRPAAVEGPQGRPVVVNNVESVAAVAVLAALGVDRYRAVGSPHEPGTRLLTVHRAPGAPVLVEVATGTPVRDALAAAGAPVGPVQAVLVGGYFGRWLAPEAGLGAPLSHAGLAALGGTLGAGVVIAPPGGGCVLGEVAAVVEHLAAQNAGQCGPCVNGLPAIAGVLSALAAGEADDAAIERVHHLAGVVTGRGACKHPDGVAMFAGSALAALSGEVAAHVAGGCGLPVRGWLPVGGERG